MTATQLQPSFDPPPSPSLSLSPSHTLTRLQYLVIIISLASAMFLLRNGSTWAIYCAALFLLPYLALKYSLHAQYDSMLLGTCATKLVRPPNPGCVRCD